MAVRSKRLVDPVLAVAAPAVIYTCGSGETTLVKFASIYNPNAAATTVVLTLNGVLLGNVLAVIPAAGLAGAMATMFLVLHPGDVVRVSCAGAAGAVVSLHGAELEGVAD